MTEQTMETLDVQFALSPQEMVALELRRCEDGSYDARALFRRLGSREFPTKEMVERMGCVVSLSREQ